MIYSFDVQIWKVQLNSQVISSHPNMSIFVEHVGSYAFYKCSRLTGPLTFSSNWYEIGDYAFYGCTSLAGPLHLGFGLRRIGK